MSNKPILRMSSAGTCPRALSAELLGYTPEPKPVWLETSALEGRWHEERIVQELISEGYKVFDRQLELKIEMPTFILLGHIDGKVEKGNGFITALLEIKSMSQYEFDRWYKEGFAGFQSYADQITCYAKGTKLNEIFYIVKNRSSGYTEKKLLDKIPGNFEAIAEQLTYVIKSVNKKELFRAEADFSSLECKRCSYKKLCVPTKEDMTIQTEKVLLNAAEDWRKGKELEIQSKELIASAKSVFEEQTIASKQKRWAFANLAISNITVKEHEVPAHLQKEFSYIKIEDTNKEK